MACYLKFTSTSVCRNVQGTVMLSTRPENYDVPQIFNIV